MPLKWKNDSIEKSFGFKLDQIYFTENIFQAIYFIDSVSNALLLCKKYSNQPNANEDLISSFLGALNMFIKEIKSNKDEEIQEINFKATRILYERKGRLIIIGITEKMNLQLERKILNEVLNDFYDKFEHEINHFKGFIDPKILNYKTRLTNLNLFNLI